MFARIRCKVSRERIQHSPTCPRLAFSHNSISTLVKQRGWFHTACLIPATVPTTKTQISVWLHTSYKGYKIQVKSYRSQWRGHQEGLVKCVKYKKLSRQLETTGDAPTHGRQTNPFNTSPYKQKAKKKKRHLIVLLPSTCTPSLFRTLTLHFLLFPSPSLTLWLSVSGYTFFFCFLCNLPHFSSLVDGKSSSVMDWDADSQRSPDSCHGNSWIMTEYPCIIHFIPPSYSVSNSQSHFLSLLLINSLSLLCTKGDGTGFTSCAQENHINWCKLFK